MILVLSSDILATPLEQFIGRRYAVQCPGRAREWAVED